MNTKEKVATAIIIILLGLGCYKSIELIVTVFTPADSHVHYESKLSDIPTPTPCKDMGKEPYTITSTSTFIYQDWIIGSKYYCMRSPIKVYEVEVIKTYKIK